MEPEVIADKQVATTHLFKCLESIPNCPYRLSRYSLSTEHVWERNWADGACLPIIFSIFLQVQKDNAEIVP